MWLLPFSLPSLLMGDTAWSASCFGPCPHFLTRSPLALCTQVQELHEEEAQWVNYDEDELCVKMQLAEGIFESLLRDTVDVLNEISEKQGRALLV